MVVSEKSYTFVPVIINYNVEPNKKLSNKMKTLTMIVAALAMTVAMQAQTVFHDVEANQAKGAVILPQIADTTINNGVAKRYS